MKYSYLIVLVTILSLIGIGIQLEFGHHTFGGLYMENGHIIIISIPIIFLGLLNKQVLFLGLTIFLSGLLTFVGTSIILVKQEAQSAENAKGIVKALNSYNADKGAYPVTLKDLLPNYLTTIPITAMGISDHAFTYRRLEDSYFLSFPENEKHYYYRVLGDKVIHPCQPVGC
jgi:hypothetical protein